MQNWCSQAMAKSEVRFSSSVLNPRAYTNSWILSLNFSSRLFRSGPVQVVGSTLPTFLEAFSAAYSLMKLAMARVAYQLVTTNSRLSHLSVPYLLTQVETSLQSMSGIYYWFYYCWGSSKVGDLALMSTRRLQSPSFLASSIWMPSQLTAHPWFSKQLTQSDKSLAFFSSSSISRLSRPLNPVAEKFCSCEKLKTGRIANRVLTWLRAKIGRAELIALFNIIIIFSPYVEIDLLCIIKLATPWFDLWGRWGDCNNMLQQGDPLKQIIRYEEQLKASSQRIEVLLLEDSPANLPVLKDLIAEEEQLVKYLEVESSKLSPQSKAIYSRNMTRFKRKIKQHKDYIASNHGSSFLPVSQHAAFMQYQNQNAMLAQNKLTMYQNQRVQEGLGRELHDQGQKLYGGIQHNRDIRGQADQAEGSIHLIQMSILKRKVMFLSLVALFIGAVILVLIVKAHRK